MCVAVYFRISSTPGRCKSSRLNGLQDNPDAIHTALPDNNSASGLRDDLWRLNRLFSPALVFPFGPHIR